MQTKVRHTLFLIFRFHLKYKAMQFFHKLLMLFFIVNLSQSVFAQSTDSSEILKVMSKQEAAWNEGKIANYMQGYWPSDSLMFIGKSGVTYGYDATLKNYLRGYPDTASMGKLKFNILEMKKISSEYYFIVGKWFLKRSIGDIGGHFTLLFHKIKGKWLIVADHSS